MHIAGISTRLQIASLEVPVSGTVQAAFAVLNGPRLSLLRTLPPPLPTATGEMTGTVKVLLPLKPHLTTTDVRMNVATLLSNVTLPLPLEGLTLRQGRLTVDATLQNLDIKGDAELFGQPAGLSATANFRGNAAPAVTFDMQTTATAATLQALGWAPGGFIQGAMPVHLHVETGAANNGRLTVNADLSQAMLQLPMFGWSKPAGKSGSFSLAASIDGDRFSGIQRIDSIAAKAPGLDIATAMAGNTLELSHIQIGNTKGSGRIVAPGGKNQPWRIALTGSALDLSAIVNPPRTARSPAKPARPSAARPQPPSGFTWQANAHFDRLILAERPEPELQDFNFIGNGQGDFVFRGNAAALVDAGKPVTLMIAPRPGVKPGDAETMQLQTDDAGELLRAMGAFNTLTGGALDFSASYGVALPVEGVTRITHFRLLNAPAFAKFLQAVTVLGIPEAASGPGLQFDRMVVPFSIDDDVMTLAGGRAYSAALGFTASGTIDLDAGRYDIHGTVVPAYALNTLPGKIPLIGRLFSPEKGGGLFAMRYTLTGPFADPKVKINPLSALTPGFLRGIFGLGNGAKQRP
jgi:hypothetical protein